MIEIPCQVRRFIGSEFFIFIPISIRVDKIVGHVSMMIDTGSAFTLIAPKDLMRFRYSLKALSRAPAKTVQLAGNKFKRSPLGEAKIILRRADDQPFFVQSEQFCSLTPTKVTKQVMAEVVKIPSILGNDFLRELGASLRFNPGEKTASLEIE